MPTAPDPNSPYINALARPDRKPGEPQTAGTPTPEPSKPAPPAPPAPAQAPLGRPPAPPTPAPPTATGAPPAPPTAQPPAPPKPAAPAQPAAPPVPTGYDAATGMLAQRPQFTGARPPQQTEFSNMPPGSQVTTGLGTTEQNPVDGRPQTTLSPEGQQKYREHMVARVKAFGPMPKIFSGIPDLPKPPIVAGKPAFNPFTGRWSK